MSLRQYGLSASPVRESTRCEPLPTFLLAPCLSTMTEMAWCSETVVLSFDRIALSLLQSHMSCSGGVSHFLTEYCTPYCTVCIVRNCLLPFGTKECYEPFVVDCCIPTSRFNVVSVLPHVPGYLNSVTATKTKIRSLCSVVGFTPFQLKLMNGAGYLIVTHDTYCTSDRSSI